MWTTCGKGHDLTEPDAYVYNMTGSRRCRKCAEDEGGKQTKRPRMDTWHEKIQRTRATFA